MARWQDQGLCHNQQHIFDGAEYETAEGVYITIYPDLDIAKAICAECPVFASCDAAGKKERNGIWAGRPRK